MNFSRAQFKLGFLSSAILLSLSACSTDTEVVVLQPYASCADAGEQCQKFTVLHTNDNHGRFWHNADGEYGMAARKTLIDQLRAEIQATGGEVLLLSGGDINTGVPESDMQDAEPDFKGMNAIGYDAMAVGNHEFDNSLAVLEQQREWLNGSADIPMLAANIYKRDVDGQVTDERYFEPYRVFEKSGLKIAVIGLTTKDTAHLVDPSNIESLYFEDPQVEIKKVLAEIKANEQVDLVIATTHMGHYENGQHGSEAPGDVALARTLVEGQLQAIIGGHSQNPVCMEGDNKYADFEAGQACRPDQQNGTWIMQAHEWGKYVGRADFEFYNGKLHLANYDLVPVNLLAKNSTDEQPIFIGQYLEHDAAMIDLLQPFQDKGDELLSVKISHTDGKLEGDRNLVRSEPTNLAQLLGQAYRSYHLVGADFGLMNGGGIRDSIPAGDVTYRSVLQVQPFGNFVTKATMTGAEVKDYIAQIGGLTGGAYAHLENIQLTFDCDTQETVITDINGKGFEESDTYTFSLLSFTAAGGDNYPKIEVLNTQQTDAEVVRAFFEKHPEIKVADFEPQGNFVRLSGGQEVASCPTTN